MVREAQQHGIGFRRTLLNDPLAGDEALLLGYSAPQMSSTVAISYGKYNLVGCKNIVKIRCWDGTAKKFISVLKGNTSASE